MYSYDRRIASSAESILRLILRGVENERPTASLVQAYIDEVIEDLDGEPRDLSFQERDHWLEREVGVLLRPEDVEKALLKTYTSVYLAKVPWANLAVFDHPSGFPNRVVPRKIVEAVGRQIALQDADEAHALRELALSRGHSH
jgi:hypothetical protein